MKTLALVALSVALVSVSASPVIAELELGAEVSLSVAVDSKPLRRAAEDLGRDLGWVLGRAIAPTQEHEGEIVVGIDSEIPGPEGYRIRVTDRGVRIDGSDELGAIYGIYAFSHRHLGVDPLWFWTQRKPAARKSLRLPVAETLTGPPRFRYRGLFINDEDLLGRWREPSGQRFGQPSDKPLPPTAAVENAPYEQRLRVYYGPVINLDVMEAIYETVLRLRGNLIVSASFVDVMNPPEAELIRRAVARGLYVSQHHVEPLGVSFFAFEEYWARQKRSVKFSYVLERELFRQAWRDYAQAWHKLAGDRVIWQLGLRGRGDRSAWQTDPTFNKSKAGAIISEALATQSAIVREVDQRPQPPMTLTLWAEMANLLKRGEVTVPPGVTLVHADSGDRPGAAMDVSYGAAREADRGFGAYLHVAVWNRGPHLVQGVAHDGLTKLIDDIARKGDTRYALVNAANIAEHILPLRTAMDRLAKADAPSALVTSVPANARPLYERLIAIQLQGGGNDGRCLMSLLSAIAGKGAINAASAKRLDQSAEDLAALATEAESLDLPSEDARFVRRNLSDQARILAGLYRATAALMGDDRAQGVADATIALRAITEVYERQDGPWRNWYRGDTKVNVRGLILQLNATKAKD